MQEIFGNCIFLVRIVLKVYFSLMHQRVLLAWIIPSENPNANAGQSANGANYWYNGHELGKKCLL